MEKIQKSVLNNGLELFYQQVNYPETSVIASLNAGSLYETEKESGISHFIEHSIFKKTKKRKSREDIYSNLRNLGTNFYCHTSFKNIPLGLSVLTEDFEECLELISDILYYTEFDQKEIEKEKLIVLDEIRHRNDNLEIKLIDEFYKLLFQGTIAGKLIIGTEENIRNFEKKQIEEFYYKHFNPANTTLFIVGPLPFNKIEKKVKKYFGHMNLYPRLKEPIIKNISYERRFKKIIEPRIKNAKLIFGRHLHEEELEFKKETEKWLNLFYYKFRNASLNEHSISYYSNYFFDNQLLNFRIIADFHPKDYDLINYLIDKNLENLPRYKAKDFNQNINFKNHKRRTLLNYNTTMKIAKCLVHSFLNGKVQNPEDILNDFYVDKKKLKKAYDSFREKELSEIIILPE